MGSSSSVLNFGAGPAKLPTTVLEAVQKELLSYNNMGLSIMEMSHRSPEYSKINNEAQRYVRELLKVPDNYKILFMQGGGTGAFAAIALNLLGRTGTADYMVTGTWSAKAAKEAAKYGEVKLVFPRPAAGTIPPSSTWKFNADAAYVYYCANETVDGVEFAEVPHVPDGVPLVSDMSSSIMTRPLDVHRFGLIFAGAQKNIGPAGVTVAIVRDDLLGHAMPICPSVFDFANIAKENSVHNTPATFSVYVMHKVFEWIATSGGVDEMERQAIAKSTLLYDTIAASNGFYSCPVANECRSRMNVPFRVCRTPSAGGDEALEERFLVEAKKRYMQQLKGHRSVGGVRASLYNAVSLNDVQLLVQFMKEFQKTVMSEK